MKRTGFRAARLHEGLRQDVLAAVLLGNQPPSARTLDVYCAALTGGDYEAVYQQLSPRLQAAGSEQQLARLLHAEWKETLMGFLDWLFGRREEPQLQPVVPGPCGPGE